MAELTPEQLTRLSKQSGAYQIPQEKSELTAVQWRYSIDRYLYGDGYLEAEHYVAMSETQKFCIQEIKKAKKRSTYSNNKGNLHHSLE